jgi:hypothetical protein
VLASAGLGIGLIRIRRYGALLCLSLPVIATGIGLFTLSKVQFLHYFLPVLPCICLVAGIGIEAASELVARSENARLATVAALAIALASPELWRESRSAWAKRVPDTGAAAVAWVRGNCPPDTKIGLDDEQLNLLPSPAAVERNLALARARGFTGRADYWASLERMIASDRKNPHYDLYILYGSDEAEEYLDYLRSRGVEYLIRSKNAEEIFGSDPSTARGRSRLSFYKDLESRAQVVAVIDSKDGRHRGSAFTIYRIPTSAAIEDADSSTGPSLH